MSRMPGWAVIVSALLLYVGGLVIAVFAACAGRPGAALFGFLVAFAALPFALFSLFNRGRPAKQNEFLSAQDPETRDTMLRLERYQYLFFMPSNGISLWLFLFSGWLCGRAWSVLDPGGVYYLPTYPGWLAVSAMLLVLGTSMLMAACLFPRIARDHRAKWAEFASTYRLALRAATQRRIAIIVMVVALTAVIATAASYTKVGSSGLTVHRLGHFSGTHYGWGSIRYLDPIGSHWTVRFTDGSSWSVGGSFPGPHVPRECDVALYILEKTHSPRR